MKRLRQALVLLLAIAAMDALGCNRHDGQSLPSEEPIGRFVAEVKWIEMTGKRTATVVPVGVVDLHWLVGIEILSIEKPAKHFDKKGQQVLLIHSPTLLFQEGSQTNILGKKYLFSVFGEIEDGVPHYEYAEARPRRD